MALMNQLGDKTKSIKRPEIPTNRIKPKADVKTATKSFTEKAKPVNAVKSTSSALYGVRRNIHDAIKPISDEVSKFKDNGSKQEPPKNVFEYQDLVRMEHSGLGNSPEIADERKPFRINTERAQKESDDFEKRLSNAKMDLFDSNGNLIDYQKQVSDIDSDISKIKEQFNAIKDTDGNNDLKFNMLDQIQELEVKKNPLEDMAELQNEYASYASYQNALQSGNDEDLRKASYDLSAYNDSFFERRLYALGRTANNMVASAVTLADILRDVGGEIAGNSVEHNARALIEEGKIDEAKFNEMMSEADQFRAFSATDENNLSTQLRNYSDEITERINTGVGTVESVLGDAVDSSVQFALLYYGFSALGGQAGALAGADNVAKMAGTFGKYGSLVSMSAMSATDKYVYCMNNGYTMEQSLGNAVLTGALSYMTEQIGVDSFVNVVSGNGGTYFASLVENGFGNALNSSTDLALRYMVESAVKNGASEGLEELIEGTLSPVIDSITLGVPLEYNAGDLFKQVMCGTLSGAFMGAPASYSYAISTNEQYNALINDISQLKGKLEGADLSSNEGKNIVAMLNGAEQALRVYESKSVTAGRIVLSTDGEGNAQMSNDNSMLIDSIAPTVDEGIEFEELQKSMSNAIYGLSSNYMSSIGLDPSELDPIVYSSLSPEARNEITNSIQSGKLTSKSAGEYLEFEKGITTDYQLASQGIHMTMEEFASLPMNDRISAYKIAQISNSTGATIVVQKNMTTEDGERVTGINKNGVLYVDPSDPSSTIITTFHEVAHSLEYTKAYKKLSNAVINSIKSSGKSFDALVDEAKPIYENEINRDFEKSGLPKSMYEKFATEYAQKEVIAEYFGMMVANDFMVDANNSKNIVKMATDIGFIKSLVKYQNGPAYRIYNNMISYFGNDVAKAKNAFNRAIIELNSENRQNGTKYQFISQNSLVNAFYKNGTADSEKLLDFHSTAMDLLYSAMEYENDGMPMHEIHKNTGWYKHDGVWKFEFYDEAFVHSVYIDAIDAIDNPIFKITKEHPVPIVRSNPFTLTDEIFGGELGVYFDYSLDFYTRGYVNIHDGKFDIFLNPNSFKKETIAHELQHLFQKILDFEEYKLSESELKTKEATKEYLDSLIAGDEDSDLAEDMRYDEYWADKSEVEARVAGDAYVNEENRLKYAYTILYKPYDNSEYYQSTDDLEDSEYIVLYDGEMKSVPIEDIEDDFIIEVEDADSPKYQKLAYNYGNYIRNAINDSSKKSESMHAYGGRHGTGEFGTGTYFVGSVTEDSYYGSKTRNAVDFDMNGNLFRPRNTEEGFKLSNFLRHLNNAVLNDGRMFNSFDEIYSAKERVNEVIDNTVEVNYPSYSIEEAEYNDFLIKNPEPEYVYPEYYEEDLENSLSALFLGQIDNGKARIKNEDEYRKYEQEFKNWSLLKAKWLNEQIAKYGTVSTSHDVANALSVEFGLNAQDMEDVTDFSKELDRAVMFAEKGLENRRYAESEIMSLQGYNQDYMKAMDDAFAGDYVNGSDTPSTVFMKSLGYNGVDVTGIDRLDNFTYGSVIYDVNPDSIVETKFNRSDFRDESLMRDNAVIAPYYDSQLTLENREQLSKVEETFVNRANAIAESLGTKVIDYEENIGGFVNANNVALNELSYTFILEGNDREKADMFANLMADMGNEVQEAVIAYDYRDGGDESFDGWEIRIGVKDAEEASKALRENGINDYTVGRTSGLVKIYSPFNDEQRIIRLKEILGDNYDGTECTIRKYNSRYQDSETRRRAYEEWVKSKVRESTEDGNNSQNRLERIIRQALDNLDEFTSNVPQRAVEAKQVGDGAGDAIKFQKPSFDQIVADNDGRTLAEYVNDWNTGKFDVNTEYIIVETALSNGLDLVVQPEYNDNGNFSESNEFLGVFSSNHYFGFYDDGEGRYRVSIFDSINKEEIGGTTIGLENANDVIDAIHRFSDYDYESASADMEDRNVSDTFRYKYKDPSSNTKYRKSKFDFSSTLNLEEQGQLYRIVDNQRNGENDYHNIAVLSDNYDGESKIISYYYNDGIKGNSKVYTFENSAVKAYIESGERLLHENYSSGKRQFRESRGIIKKLSRAGLIHEYNGRGNGIRSVVEERRGTVLSMDGDTSKRISKSEGLLENLGSVRAERTSRNEFIINNVKMSDIDVINTFDYMQAKRLFELNENSGTQTVSFDDLKETNNNVKYQKSKVRASKIDPELFKPSDNIDSEGNNLTVGQDRYFSKSQNRNHDGELLYMYHGGKEKYDGGRINEFDPEMSDDLRSLFFTSNIYTAGSYSNNALGEYAPFRYDSVDDINRVLNKNEGSVFSHPSLINYVQNEDGTVSAVPSEYAKETAHEFVKRFQPVTYSNIDEAYNAIVNEEQEYKTRQNYDYNESGTNNAVYLNIENPVKLEAYHENWDSLEWEAKDQLVGKDLKCFEVDVNSLGTIYTVNGEEFDDYELEEQFGSAFADEVRDTINDGRELLFEYKTRDGDSMYSYMNTLRDISEYAYFTGHDGMICSGVTDTGGFGLFEDSDGDILGRYSTVATVFNSNQAKSVNNLAPTKHNDTRYRKSVLDWGNGNVELTNAPLNQELKKQFEDATKQYIIASDRANSEVDESIVSTPESEELASKYGAIERGENPVREVNVPMSTDGKNRVHKGLRTVAESKHVTDEEVVSMLNSLTSESRGTYNVRTNDATTKRAMKTVLESDTAELDSLLLAQDELSLDRYAQLSIRLSEIQNAGEINTEHGQEMLSKWLDMQNEAGSMVQYTRAFKNLDPERRVRQVENRVNKVQSELDSKYGNKAPKIKVDSELIENLRKASSEKDIKKAGEAITENIMNQVPPTLMEKIDAWRFISMLANPRTHIRNIAGNFAFGGLYSYRNTIATMIEQSMVKSGKIDAKNAVHSFITSEDNELMKRAEAFYETHKSEIERNSNGKYKDSRRHSRPFKTEWINTLYELNGKLLSKEDTLSSKPRYVKTLAEIMKARGITSEATDAELFNIADYALAESERATFNNRNSFAHKLSEIERKLDSESWSKHPVEKTGALIMKAMVPFKNTPMNIINQAMDFSPLGLVWNSSKGVYEYSYDKSHGTSKFNANEFVNKISSGVAGSSLFIVGFFLAKAGILKGKSKAKDKKEKKFREDHGEQEYSINFNVGDKKYSYTIDWLAPAVIPMFMGQALYDSMGDGLTPDDVFSIATGVIDPITEMTMLQSLNTSLKSYSSEGLSGVGMNAMSSYISQFIPTIFGQVARSIDGTSRTTYPYDGYLEKTGRSIQSRIPIANMGLNPSVKSDGTVAKNNGLGAGLAGRMFMNMISAGYGTKIEYDEYDEELMRLFESNGDSSVLPSSINRNISYTDKNGNKHEFKISYEDYDDYQIDRWSTEKKYVDEFIGSKTYKSLGDEERTRIISEIRKYGGLYAKDKYLQKNGIKFEDSSYEKAKGAIDAGLGVGEYFIAKDFMNEINGDYAKKERVDYISGLDVSDKAKNFLYDSQYGDSKLAGYANDMDVSDKERLAIKSASSIEGIKDSNGKTISNTKALAVADAYADAGVLDDVIEYINENGLEPKDFGLSKSLMGMSSSKLSSEYEKYYREQFGNGDSSEYGKYFKGYGGGSSRKLKSSKISAFKKGMNSMSSTVKSAVNSLSPSKVKAPDETIDVQQAIARIKKRNGRWLS